jgi:hypothetical protein
LPRRGGQWLADVAVEQDRSEDGGPHNGEDQADQSGGGRYRTGYAGRTQQLAEDGQRTRQQPVTPRRQWAANAKLPSASGMTRSMPIRMPRMASYAPSTMG